MALSNSINSNCYYFDVTPTPNPQRDPNSNACSSHYSDSNQKLGIIIMQLAILLFTI